MKGRTCTIPIPSMLPHRHPATMPWLSRFWMYFPVPLAGVAMIIFEIEALYNHVKSFFVKEEN